MILIAEIGTAHGGSLEQAERLIDAAAASGAHIAKFQIVFAHEIIHPLTGEVPLPGGPTPLFDVFRSLERNGDFFFRLKELTEAAGMEFLATPFGQKSARLLKSLEPGRIKLASPELNHFPLIKELVSYDKPLILSSGVSTMDDIRRALALTGIETTTLLHCITSYPAPEEEYNLRLLPLYQSEFGVATGISDHSLDPLLVPLLSMAMGGVMLEKHFTLSREEGGLDDPIALEPKDFKRMAEAVTGLENDSPESILQNCRERFGNQRVEAVLGSGIKELAPSEQANYGRTNRSIHALCDLEPGDILSEENCAVLRTEKILNPGMAPIYWEHIQGKPLIRPVKAGQGLNEEDLDLL